MWVYSGRVHDGASKSCWSLIVGGLLVLKSPVGHDAQVSLGQKLNQARSFFEPASVRN